MCGISGVFNFHDKPVQKEELKAMTDAIVHRGPDGEGFWISKCGQMGFGHRRLSIIDLSNNGDQPMKLGERFVICFNGEIYNYIELKSQLKSEGFVFNTTSDTEVLLAMYAKYGPDCLGYLDGMFAIAIWDEEKRELFIARDRFGEKPFYFSNSEKRFIFCSEMKGLWANGVEKKVVESKVNDFIQFGNYNHQDDTNATFYENIYSVPNASFAVIKAGEKVQFRKYYQIDISKKCNLSENQAIEKFHDLFLTSIKRRLRSDVPVGSSLSGGLDSSAVVSFIAQLKSEQQKQLVFSAKFPGFKKDESKFIDKVIHHLGGIEDFAITPNEVSLEKDLEDLVFHQEEPFRSASIFVQWSVMKLAKQNGVTVMLDGQGADEYLAGYIPYYRTYFNQEFIYNKGNYIKEYEAFKKLRGNLEEFQKQKETFRMKMGRYKAKFLKAKGPISPNYLKERLRQDMTSGNLIELLRYADRNAMAHSIETRLPFLSHELVDYVFTLPDSLLLREGWTKFILRKSIEPYLPEEIVWRVEKVGYEPPQDSWMESNWVTERIAHVDTNYDSDIQSKSKYTDDIRWRKLLVSYYL